MDICIILATGVFGVCTVFAMGLGERLLFMPRGGCIVYSMVVGRGSIVCLGGRVVSTTAVGVCTILATGVVSVCNVYAMGPGGGFIVHTTGRFIVYSMVAGRDSIVHFSTGGGRLYCSHLLWGATTVLLCYRWRGDIVLFMPWWQGVVLLL